MPVDMTKWIRTNSQGPISRGTASDNQRLLGGGESAFSRSETPVRYQIPSCQF